MDRDQLINEITEEILKSRKNIAIDTHYETLEKLIK